MKKVAALTLKNLTRLNENTMGEIFSTSETIIITKVKEGQGYWTIELSDCEHLVLHDMTFKGFSEKNYNKLLKMMDKLSPSEGYIISCSVEKEEKK